MSPQLERVEREETLHRALKPNPVFWSSKTGKPSSALFKDSKGVSVDIKGERSDPEIKDSFLSKFPDLRGEVRIGAEFCFSITCDVLYNPVDGNEYHSLIIRGEGRIDAPQLTKSQAKKVANSCQVIEY